MKAIVVFGNLTDGFTFVGPFDSFDEASKYADSFSLDSWIATLSKPIGWESNY